MKFNVHLTLDLEKKLDHLYNDPSQIIIAKAVRKALKKLENNPKDNALNTHEFYEYKGPNGERIWQSYAQNNTPSAYRIFWYYCKLSPQTIRVISIIPHT